jgi:hypothetical protein
MEKGKWRGDVLKHTAAEPENKMCVASDKAAVAGASF